MRLSLATILILLIARSAIAAQVTLPLDGWYRPGRFFPVMVTSDAPVTAEVDLDGGVGAKATGKQFILPVMLLSGDTQSITVTVDGHTSDVPVRALADEQFLVIKTDLAPVNVDRSPDKVEPKPDANRIVTSTLVPTPLIDAAFESADELWVNDASAESARAAAWRSGVPAVEQIDAAVPARSNAFRGPNSSRDDAAIYDALGETPPQRSAAQIRTTLLLATLFCVLVLAVAVMLRRRAWLAIVGISAVAAAVGVMAIRKPAIVTSDRAVLLPSPRFAQEDDWTFRTALNDADDVFPVGSARSVGHFPSGDTITDRERSVGFGEITRPIFSGQASTVKLWIEPTPDGWTFHEHLPRGMSMAFVTRSLDARPPGTLPVTPAEPSAWTRAVQRLYTGPGDVVGVTRDENNRLITTVQPATANPSDSTNVTTSAKPAPH